MSAMRPKSDDNRYGIVVLIVVTAMVLIMYLTGMFFFGTHFYPNTSLLGHDVSCKPFSAERDVLSDVVASWRCQVTGHGVDLGLSAEDVGLSVAEDIPSASEAQHAELWPFEVWGTHVLRCRPGTLSVNREAVASVMSGVVDKANEGRERPRDAVLSYSADTSRFEVVPEVEGDRISSDAVFDAVMKAASSLSESVEIGDKLMEHPACRKSDAGMDTLLEKAESFVSVDAGLSVDNTRVLSISRHDMASWLTSEGSSVVVDAARVDTWVSQVAIPSLDTLSRERRYVDVDGKEVFVPAGSGTYGWHVDGTALSDELQSFVMSGKGGNVEVPFSARAAKWVPGGADWPSRYVDVNLTECRVRFIDNGTIVLESACVCGDEASGNGTPEGVFSLGHTSTNTTLVDAGGGSGSDSYQLPVSFWMPFFEGCGLHDASWRNSFGPSATGAGGSHGCVNLPYDAAAALFGMVSEGDVVVVHR